ncbi:MAG: hypothetical protein ACOVNY_06810 [Chitinophagaceae bacterium]
MTILGYGVILKRITVNDIELIRKWRNSKAIRNKMFFKRYIAKSQQIKWFHEINNHQNNYFLIFYHDTAVGLINGGAIDWEKNITGNGGIFIWDSNVKDELVAIKASILLTDCGFYLGMKKNIIKILKTNFTAISYNTMLGYVKDENFIHPKLNQYYLTPEMYFPKIAFLRDKIYDNNQIAITIDSKSMEVTHVLLERIKENKIEQLSHIKIHYL